MFRSAFHGGTSHARRPPQRVPADDWLAERGILSKPYATGLRCSDHPFRLTPARKVTAISHLWPLLREGQDPDSLAARVAYHLHRTHNRTTALTRAGLAADRSFASDVVQGRLPLTQSDVEFIAGRLALPSSELTRPLTPEEQEAWAFYRTSGRNRRAVWERARSVWQRHGLANNAAANAMGLSRTALSNIFSGHNSAVLRHDQAAKLAIAIGNPDLPSLLIEGLKETPSRA